MVSAVFASRQSLAQRLRQPRAFAGMVCYNDFTAVGAYAALLSAGVSIPRQMSVIGFDDVMAAYLHPRLTTVSHMLVQMGRRVAELALELAEEPAARARLAGYCDVLVPELLARDRAPLGRAQSGPESFLAPAAFPGYPSFTMSCVPTPVAVTDREVGPC